MNIVYAAMWLMIAVILFSMGLRENKIYLVFSFFFVFNCVWWAASFFSKADMFHGTLGWVFRGITAVFLVTGCLFYVKEKKKNIEE